MSFVDRTYGNHAFFVVGFYIMVYAKAVQEEKEEVAKMSLAYGIIALISLCMIGL